MATMLCKGPTVSMVSEHQTTLRLKIVRQIHLKELVFPNPLINNNVPKKNNQNSP